MATRELKRRRHNGLIVALREDVPVGFCIYCELRPPKGKKIQCGSGECLRAYWRDHQNQRRANLPNPPLPDVTCGYRTCLIAFRPTNTLNRYCCGAHREAEKSLVKRAQRAASSRRS